MRNDPIGIFDSGIGGLTVASEITKALPNENIIYLGDTARVPYGTRGKEIITKFALELATFLLHQKVKLLVAACNTISATCLNNIFDISPVPVIGVINPAVKKIIQTTKNNKVGIIGTRATTMSKAYDKEINKLAPEIKLFTKACPLLVPIAEEGLAQSSIAKLAVKEYLTVFLKTDIDTLHLGCTHYPLLRNVIQAFMGNNVTIIDSAQPTAEEVKKLLTKEHLLNRNPNHSYQFLITDSPNNVYKTAALFFGKEIKNSITKVDLREFD